VLLGTPLGNTLRTWGTTWEHGRNTSATHIKKTFPPSPLPPKLKLKSWGSSMDAAPSHWLHAISISKIISYLLA